METKREMDFQTLAAWLHAFPPGWKPRLKGRLEACRHFSTSNLIARSSYLP